MEYLVVCTVALLVAGLTLYSGFGLGTLLMPKVTLASVRLVVGVMLVVVGLGLASGVL
ncbi:MAG: hypothetical protein R6W93_01230 [Candidatus Limnocylindrales bacterium]